MWDTYWTERLIRQLERDLRDAADDEPEAEHLSDQLSPLDMKGKIDLMAQIDTFIDADIITTVAGKTTDISKLYPWLREWKKRHMSDS